MTIYRQFRVTYRKRLLVYSLLCVALATGNALFWLHKWHEQGVELCFADTMMTGVQPSFLLMLLIPPTLGLVHQLKFILEQPFVICALDNRARLARNLLAFCLCIFCSFVWGQVFAISCLVAVSFTEFPSPFLCYAMLIRCRAMSPAGFDERAGLLFYLIFAGIVCFIGMFLFLQLDLFPGLQRRPQ